MGLTNLLVRIGADASQFKQGMAGAQQSVSGFGAGIRGGIVTAVAAATAALGTLAVAATGVGIRFNAMEEQSHVAWTTLLGDADAATKMMADINSFAAKTPFSKMGVDTMAKQLKNAGYEGQEIFDQLTMIGDMGSAFGIQEESLKELTRQYAQVQQSQVAYTEDLNILQDRGIPIYKAIAETMNIPIASVKKMASEGKITADVYNAAIGSIAKNTKGAMDAQSKTFNGMLSTLKDNLTMLAGLLSKPMFDLLKKGMEGVLPLVGNLMSVLKGEMSGFDFFKSLGLSDGAISKVMSAFEIVKGVVSTFVSVVVGYFNVYKEYVTGLFSGDGNVGQSFARIFGAIQTIAVPLLQSAVAFIKSILSQLSAFWEQNGQSIIAAVQNLWSIIAVIFQAAAVVLLPIVMMVWSSIKSIIQGAVNVILGIIKIFSGLFTLDFGLMWEGIKQGVLGAVQFIWNYLNLMFVGRILGGLKAMASGAISSVAGMWGAVKTAFSAGINSAKTSFLGMVNNIKSVWGTLRTFGASISNAIKEVIILAWNATKSRVVSVVGSLKSGVVTAFNTLKSTVSSIFNGVKSAITNPIETAKTTVLGIIDGIKNAFSRMSISIPKPKLPHISWSMKEVAGGIVKIPDFDISWYAKGGMFNGPSVIGVGEQPGVKEAVIPMSGTHMKPFAETIAGLIGMNGGNGTNGNITVEVPLVIDGKEVARATAPHVGKEIDTLIDRRNRMLGGARIG